MLVQFERPVSEGGERIHKLDKADATRLDPVEEADIQ